MKNKEKNKEKKLKTMGKQLSTPIELDEIDFNRVWWYWILNIVYLIWKLYILVLYINIDSDNQLFSWKR